MDYTALARDIKRWGVELGFQAVGIADADLSAAEPRLLEWLAQGWHGEMEYMARHGALRARPAELKAGTLRVISCRMNYLNEQPAPGAGTAVIARYAQGRDYHAGGARYNTSYIQGVGIGTITDELSAIKKHVFEDKTLSMSALLEILEADFVGFERERQ